ncbi:hypothetical protein EYF80_053432 [Liparis tanakae]|uniref:Uncharacterized protein n=1 Tax=Liparis tanakae TaxID=230148 RepID=A0A4Z2F6J8_9TELE|nr:hypothetical protein EYF80_053432 [Liparis tanakae]
MVVVEAVDKLHVKRSAGRRGPVVSPARECLRSQTAAVTAERRALGPAVTDVPLASARDKKRGKEPRTAAGIELTASVGTLRGALRVRADGGGCCRVLGLQFLFHIYTFKELTEERQPGHPRAPAHCSAP